jgi:hypothetical protein
MQDRIGYLGRMPQCFYFIWILFLILFIVQMEWLRNARSYRLGLGLGG